MVPFHRSFRPAFAVSAGVVSTGSRQATWICSTRPQTLISTSQQQVTAPRLPCRRLRCTRMIAATEISTEPVGESNTTDFRLQYKSGNGDNISPWHDIPLYPAGDKQIVNFVNEIPRGEQAKMEIATDEQSNPIKQDIKKGQLRFYKYGPSLINYGAVPQTWEDPSNLNPELNVTGDGDPLDLTEIGSTIMPFGAVYPVKILGVLGLLDEGEIDWKIIGINVDDPLASKVNDVNDVETVMPGKISEIREWFRLYKTAEGKGENEYAYNGEAKGRDFAMSVIEETHQSWNDLVKGKIPNEDELALK